MQDNFRTESNGHSSFVTTDAPSVDRDSVLNSNLMNGGKPDEAPAEQPGQMPEWTVPGQDTVPGVENTPQPTMPKPEGTTRRWL